MPFNIQIQTNQIKQNLDFLYPTNLSGYTASLAAIILILGNICVSPAYSAEQHMTTGKVTSQPIGHVYFCQQFPQDCVVHGSRSKAPKLTRHRLKEMVEVNAIANRSVEPVTDQELYGVEEHWTYPKKFGDCEDYALLKRSMLIERGWPASSLLMTVVKRPNGEGHAVLTVRTSRADYILDNLETKVYPWNVTVYKYLKRQSTKNPSRWTSIKDHRNQVARY